MSLFRENHGSVYSLLFMISALISIEIKRIFILQRAGIKKWTLSSNTFSFFFAHKYKAKAKCRAMEKVFHKDNKKHRSLVMYHKIQLFLCPLRAAAQCYSLCVAWEHKNVVKFCFAFCLNFFFLGMLSVSMWFSCEKKTRQERGDVMKIYSCAKRCERSNGDAIKWKKSHCHMKANLWEKCEARRKLELRTSIKCCKVYVVMFRNVIERQSWIFVATFIRRFYVNAQINFHK